MEYSDEINGSDKWLFVDTAPRFRLIESPNNQILSVFGDRSVSYSALNEAPLVYLDVDDFLVEHPELFEPVDETAERYYLIDIPERFAPKTDADYLTVGQIRDLLLSGDYRFYKIFNNRLLMQAYCDDFYTDIGAVTDEMLVEEIQYNLRVQHALHLGSETQPL